MSELVRITRSALLLKYSYSSLSVAKRNSIDIQRFFKNILWRQILKERFLQLKLLGGLTNYFSPWEVKVPLITLVKQIVREGSIHIVSYSRGRRKTSSLFGK